MNPETSLLLAALRDAAAPAEAFEDRRLAPRSCSALLGHLGCCCGEVLQLPSESLAAAASPGLLLQKALLKTSKPLLAPRCCCSLTQNSTAVLSRCCC